MKTLKNFEFGAGARSTHDWDKLLDGGIYQMESGTDYECKDVTFATLARNAGKSRGKTVSTGKVEGGMVIQASEASAEQVEAWAAKKAEKADKKVAEKEAADAAPPAKKKK